jgi:hypothetical protein
MLNFLNNKYINALILIICELLMFSSHLLVNFFMSTTGFLVA